MYQYENDSQKRKDAHIKGFFLVFEPLRSGYPASLDLSGSYFFVNFFLEKNVVFLISTLSGPTTKEYLLLCVSSLIVF